jgi:hypothetical protein
MNKKAHILPMAVALLALTGQSEVNASPEDLKVKNEDTAGKIDSILTTVKTERVLGTAPSGAMYELLLERGENGGLLAQHGSHASHGSHSSHTSHASHASSSHASHSSHSSHSSHASGF